MLIAISYAFADEFDFEIVDCNMGNVHGFGYTCTISNAQLANENTEILIGRIHNPEKNDSHVISVIFESSNLGFVPIDIFKTFPNLQNLKLNSVQLTEFNKFRNCEKLEYIEAWYNKVRVLKKGTFSDCRNLKTLSLYSNQIDRIEADVFHSNAILSELRFDSNQINSIERSFFKNLKAISNFKLAGNKCVNRNFNPINVENVEGTLPFFENCFSNFEEKVVDINILACDMGNVHGFGYSCSISGAQVLDDKRRILVGRVHSADKNDSDVISIIFESSKLDFIPNELLGLFPNLQNLKLNSAQLPRINKLRNCTKLLYLEAWYNKITALEVDSLSDCPNLHTLTLYSNQIARMDAGIFHPTAKLKDLRLDSNKINAISRNFFDDLKSIENFRLSGNLCVNKNFPPITPDNIFGALPYFEKCFRIYEKKFHKVYA
jgi:Leucine-rich repeat (LRR) protein